jgi:ferritin-like metal-binding protein YciE
MKTRGISGTAEGLRDLFVEQLKDMYWAEKALTKQIPKTIKKVTSEDLVNALTEHLQFTHEQVTRLENVFETVGRKAQTKKCEAMEGLIREADDIVSSTEEGVVRDAGIIAAMQKIEHYEIASYGTLKSFANILGEDEAASLLEETLDEEKEADIKMTELAESSINIEAAENDEEARELDEEDEPEEEEEEEE